jgi:hypothetical protein
MKNTRRFSVLLVVVLLASMLSASAGATGPRTTGAVVQNISGTKAAVQLSYYNQAGGVVTTDEKEIDPGAALGFSAGSSALGLPSGFVGSLVVSADQPVGAVGNDTDDTTMGMFNAITQGSPLSYLPAIYKGAGGWSTEIWIQATQEVPVGATATVKFMNRSGQQVGTTKSINLISYATVKVSPDDYADVTAGFAGGVVVESTYELGVIGRITNGNITEMYSGVSQGDVEAYAPAVYKGAGGWYSGIMVQNLDTVSTTVSIDYYDRQGNKTTTYNFPNAFVSNGVAAISTRNVAGLSEGWAGTAVIKSTGSSPIIAVVDVTNPGAGLGSMYNAALASDAAMVAYVPSQYLWAGGWTSGIIVMNVSDTAADITLEYYDRTTGAMTVDVDKLGVAKYIAAAQNSKTVPNLLTGTATTWAGSAVVRSTQPVVVVVNVTGEAAPSFGKASFYSAFPEP